MNKLKRIQKEYKDLTLNPIDNIIITPDTNNIYIWHYLIFGTQDPYKNGEYYGILTLSEDYPMKAPRIIIKTPNGRFKPDTRLCFSMSDYHQETWNPNWNIRTIMLGFYSFMLEESLTEGSIESDFFTRQQLAQSSVDFNKTINNFNTIFESIDFSLYKQNNSTNNINKISNLEIKNENIEIKNENIEKNICKFCYESDGELVNVCECKGSLGYVHIKCLKEWQLKTILNQSTHPKYQINSDIICSVCKTEYKIKNKSRKEIMEELTGENIMNQIKLGFIFISSLESSKNNLDLIKKYNDLLFYENIMNWTYGVFLIVECNNGIIAINTNYSTKKSNMSNKYLNYYNNYLIKYNLQNINSSNNIFIGGPCEEENIYGLIYLQDLDSFNVNLKNVKIIKNQDNKYLIFGEYYLIYKLYNIKKDNILKLHIYCGYAGWSNTQLIAEFAKTNWGITNTNCDVLFEKDNYNLIKQEHCLFVSKNIYSENN